MKGIPRRLLFFLLSFIFLSQSTILSDYKAYSFYEGNKTSSLSGKRLDSILLSKKQNFYKNKNVFQSFNPARTISYLPLESITNAINVAGISSLKEEDKERFARFLSKCKAPSKESHLAKLFLKFKKTDMGEKSCTQFLQDIAAYNKSNSNKITTLDFNNVEKMVFDLALKNNDPGIAKLFFGEEIKVTVNGKFKKTQKYSGGTEVSKALISFRRKLVQAANNAGASAAARYQRDVKPKDKFDLFVAFVGSEPHTFSGDEDVNFISNDHTMARRAKNASEGYIKEKTGLDNKDLDAIYTIHGDATPEVYIGDHGKIYGQEQLAKVSLHEVDLNSGTVKDGPIEGDFVIEWMLVEAEGKNCADTMIPEDKTPKKEPGVSLEMIRHLDKDIIQTRAFDPIDSIIKSCKYLARSDAALKNQGLSSSNPQLAKFARNVVEAKKTFNWSELSRLLRQHFRGAFQSKQLVVAGRPRAQLDTNEKAVTDFFKKTIALMTDNAVKGFDKRLNEIETMKSSAGDDETRLNEVRNEMIELKDMLQLEINQFREDEVEVPREILDRFDKLNKDFDSFLKIKGLDPIKDGDLKQTEETKNKKRSEIENKRRELVYSLISSDSPRARQLGVALIAPAVEKALEAATVVKKAGSYVIDLHGKLDWLDDKLLGSLHGYSDKYDQFAHDIKLIQHGQLKTPDGSIAKFKHKCKVFHNDVASINAYMQSKINSTAAGRGTMQTLQAFNIYSEAKSIVQAYSTNGWEGVGMVLARCHAPGVTAAEAIYVEENYLKGTYEIACDIFPPFAIPEGLYGMLSAAGHFSIDVIDSWTYEEVLDALAKKAKFDKNGKLVSLEYKCPLSKHDIHKPQSREEILNLPEICTPLWRLALPEITKHPLVAQFETMLKNKSVSDGEVTGSWMKGGWPKEYAGLNKTKYGPKLYKMYKQLGHKLGTKYFQKVIEELEKRHAFESGSTQKRLIEIGGELGCQPATKILDELRDSNYRDKNFREACNKVIESYDDIKKINQNILNLGKNWKAEFLEEELPSCSPDSINFLANDLRVLQKDLLAAVHKALTAVSEIAGAEKASEKEISLPAVRASLGMAYYYSGRRESTTRKNLGSLDPDKLTVQYPRAGTSAKYLYWKKEYEKALAYLEQKHATEISVELNYSQRAYCKEKVEIQAEFDRDPNKEYELKWISISPQFKIDKSSNEKVWFYPEKPGVYKFKLTLQEKSKFKDLEELGLSEDSSKAYTMLLNRRKLKQVEKEGEIEILPHSDAPEAAIELKAEFPTIGKNSSTKVEVVQHQKPRPGYEPDRFFWQINGGKEIPTVEPYITIDGSSFEDVVTVEVTARNTKHNRLDRAKTVVQVVPGDVRNLDVKIETVPPDRKSYKEGDLVKVRALVAKRKKESDLTYTWAEDGKTLKSGAEEICQISTKAKSGRTIKVRVVVEDEDKTRGRASILIRINPADFDDSVDSDKSNESTGEDDQNTQEVSDSKIKVKLSKGPKSGVVDKGSTIKFEVIKPKSDTGNYSYKWYQSVFGNWDNRPISTKPTMQVKVNASNITMQFKAVVNDDSGRVGEALTQKIKVVTRIGKTTTTTVELEPELAAGATPSKPIEIKQLDLDSVFDTKPTKMAPIPIDNSTQANPSSTKPGTATTQAPQTTSSVTTEKPPGDTDTTTGVQPIATPGGTPGGTQQIAMGTPSSGARQLTINVPKEVAKGDLFEVATVLPKGAPEGGSFVWGQREVGINDLLIVSQTGSKAKMQFNPGSSFTEMRVSCTYYGPLSAGKRTSYYGVSAPIKIKQTLLGYKVPAKWVRIKGQRDIRLEKIVYNSAMSCNLQGEVNASTGASGIKNDAELKNKLMARIKDYPASSISIKPITCGDFKGYIAETSADTDSLPNRFNAGGHAILTKGKAGLDIEFRVQGSHNAYLKKDLGPNYVFSADEKGPAHELLPAANRYLDEQGDIILKEARAIVESINFGSGAATIATTEPQTDEMKATVIGLQSSVIYGQKATIKVNGVPSDAKVKYLWHASPSLEFTNAETAGNSNSVTFSRMGAVKIWVQVVEAGASGKTLAESPQVNTTIKSPSFKMSFLPTAGAKIGQEVKATIVSAPVIADRLVTYVWSNPPSSNRFHVKENASQIKFKLFDSKPVNLSAEAVVPHHEDIIGTIKGSYTAASYKVTAKYKQPGIRPRVFDPSKKAFVTLSKNQFVVDERVTLEANLEGEPKPDLVNWKWEVNEGTTISNPNSQTPSISRSQTGTASATVTATGKGKVVYGTASVTVPFTVAASNLAKNKLVAKITSDKTTLYSLETARLSVSVNGGTPPYKYFWPRSVKGQGTSATYTAKHPGTKEVSMTVTDSKGKNATAGIKLTVKSSELKVTLKAEKTQLVVGEKAIVNATVGGGIPPYTYNWTGASGTGSLIKVSGIKPESKTVTAVVTDSLGNKGSATITLSIIVDQKIVNRDNARKLAQQAQNLASQGKMNEALNTYKQSQSTYPTENKQAAIKELKLKKQKAAAIVQEAHTLATAGTTNEALDKYKQAQSLWPTPDKQEAISNLNSKREQSIALAKEANSYASSGEMNKAFKTYKKSQELFPTKNKQNALAILKGKFEKGKSLMEEASQLAGKNKVPEAVASAENAYKIWPENKLKPVIAELRNQLNKYNKVIKTQRQTTSTTTATRPPRSKPEKFIVDNKGAVRNGPTKQFVFNVSRRSRLDFVQTYHWNYGRGKSSPGRIGVKNLSTGKLKTWQASGIAGQGGVPNAYWSIKPGYILEPAKYQLIDSDPSTWAQNASSSGVGFAKITLTPVSANATNKPLAIPPARKKYYLKVVASNYSNQNIHMVCRNDPVNYKNKVGARQTLTGRTIIYKVGNRFESIPYKVVKNGVTVDKKSWTPSSTNLKLYMAYDNVNGLRISSSQLSPPPRAPVIQKPTYRPRPPATTITPARMPASLKATMVNRSGQTVHLVFHGEGHAPHNRVAPGRSRSRVLSVGGADQVWFYVIKNGRTLALKSWKGNPQVTGGRSLQVIWNGSQLTFR